MECSVCVSVDGQWQPLPYRTPTCHCSVTSEVLQDDQMRCRPCDADAGIDSTMGDEVECPTCGSPFPVSPMSELETDFGSVKFSEPTSHAAVCTAKIGVPGLKEGPCPQCAPHGRSKDSAAKLLHYYP
jgi:hypothetical protein